MLNKLDNFYNYAMSNIQSLVSIYYAFFKHPNISNYIANLSYKGKFFYNNIKNIRNKRPWYKKSYL